MYSTRVGKLEWEKLRLASYLNTLPIPVAMSAIVAIQAHYQNLFTGSYSFKTMAIHCYAGDLIKMM